MILREEEKAMSLGRRRGVETCNIATISDLPEKSASSGSQSLVDSMQAVFQVGKSSVVRQSPTALHLHDVSTRGKGDRQATVVDSSGATMRDLWVP